MQYFESLRVPILLIGVLAALASLRYWRLAVLDPLCVLALALWALAASRIVLIALLDLTFVPALNPVYLAPASFMLTAGAILSIGAWVRLWMHKSAPNRE